MTPHESHVAEINRRLKERGFEPGELQAFLRGLRGDQLAPFTTAETELGLLDAFANMGGATVWCGDGSSCAVQIVEHQINIAIRAALRERDAQWKKVVLEAHLGKNCIGCTRCTALRALLEEAGSNG